MKVQRIQSMAAAAACWGMLAAQCVTAAPQGSQPFAGDVALGDGGVLMGQVVDGQGAVLKNAPVVIQASGQDVARTSTNDQGVFLAQGLTGGVYEVSAAEHRGVYRLWASKTAPPTASRGIVAISQTQVAPAQYGEPMGTPLIGPPPAPGGPMATQPVGPLGKTMRWVGDHPLLSAGIVATAIAVPIAVSQNDNDPAS